MDVLDQGDTDDGRRADADHEREYGHIAVEARPHLSRNSCAQSAGKGIEQRQTGKNLPIGRARIEAGDPELNCSKCAAESNAGNHRNGNRPSIPDWQKP